MASSETTYDEYQTDDNLRRDTYRVRRPHASRRRSRQKTTRKPGGIRQRRNKHWNW